MAEWSPSLGIVEWELVLGAGSGHAKKMPIVGAGFAVSGDKEGRAASNLKWRSAAPAFKDGEDSHMCKQPRTVAR